MTKTAQITRADFDAHRASVAEIRGACLRGDGHDPLDEATTLALTNHGLGVTDRLWLGGDSGFVLLIGDELHLAVAPASRREGLGRRLLDLALDEAATLSGAEPSSIFAWAHGNHPAATHLAKATGFVKVRELWVLRRNSAAPLAAQPPASGFTIRAYQAADADQLLRINAAAFASHPEQGAMDAANLAERMAEPWFDPAGLLVAVDVDGDLVGFHWTKLTTPQGAKTPVGEVYVIAVAPQAHGQGLGRALLLAGLHHLTNAGVSQVILYVESDNTPALSLYESLGFTHAERDSHVHYRRLGTGSN